MIFASKLSATSMIHQKLTSASIMITSGRSKATKVTVFIFVSQELERKTEKIKKNQNPYIFMCCGLIEMPGGVKGLTFFSETVEVVTEKPICLYTV